MCKDKMIMTDYLKATSNLLNYKDFDKLKYRDKVDLFFVDYNFIPLLIHDNYLDSMANKYRGWLDDVKWMAQATDFFSLGDNINNKIMGS